MQRGHHSRGRRRLPQRPDPSRDTAAPSARPSRYLLLPVLAAEAPPEGRHHPAEALLPRHEVGAPARLRLRRRHLAPSSPRAGCPGAILRLLLRGRRAAKSKRKMAAEGLFNRALSVRLRGPGCQER